MSNQQSGDHPAPEDLEALVRRQGPEATRLQRLDHVMGCEPCRQDFELLRAIVAAESESAIRRLPAWLPLAAALVMAVGVGGVWLSQRSNGPSDVMRDGGTAELLLLAPVDSSRSAEGSLGFVWSSVPHATGYHFELLTDEGQLVHETTTPDTTVVLVPALAAGRYRWWVTARRPEGDLSSASRLLVLR